VDFRFEQKEEVMDDDELLQTLCAQQVKDEVFDSSELLASFCDEGKVNIESLESLEKQLEDDEKKLKIYSVKQYISDIECRMKIELKNSRNDVALERAKVIELQDENTKLINKLKLMDEKVSVLEKELEGSFDELESKERKKSKSKLEKEMVKKDDAIADLTSRNKSLQDTIDNLELEKVENELRTMEMENLLRDYTEETEDDGENKETPEKIEKEVQTDSTEVNKEAELGKQLEDAYKIIVVQETNLLAKGKEIEVMSKKIRQWGLEDKLTEDNKEPSKRRRTIHIMKEETKRTDDVIIKEERSTPKPAFEPKSTERSKRKAQTFAKEETKVPKPEIKREYKTPKKDVQQQSESRKAPKTPKTVTKQNKKKLFDNDLDASLDTSVDNDELADTDPRHPTSSFNLRRKGRTHKRREKLKPIGPLLDYFMETVADVIVDKGDDPRAVGVNRYFAIRNQKPKSVVKKQETKYAFRNPGPRVHSWKEYRTKYM